MVLLDLVVAYTCRNQQDSGRQGCRSTASNAPQFASAQTTDFHHGASTPKAPGQSTPELVKLTTKEMRMPKFNRCHREVHPALGQGLERPPADRISPRLPQRELG